MKCFFLIINIDISVFSYLCHQQLSEEPAPPNQLFLQQWKKQQMGCLNRKHACGHDCRNHSAKGTWHLTDEPKYNFIILCFMGSIRKSILFSHPKWSPCINKQFFAAVIWLKYCWYCVNHYPIYQSVLSVYKKHKYAGTWQKLHVSVYKQCIL